MEVAAIKENADGSADFEFNMTDEESEVLFNAGLKYIKCPPLKYTESQYQEARDAVIRLAIITSIIGGIKLAEKSGQTTTTQE